MKDRLMGILAKARLVELDEHDLPSNPTEVSDLPIDVVVEAIPAPVVETVSLPSEGLPFVEGESLVSIFERARLPSSPFPAEKLIKVLEGLTALDPTTRRTVVEVMDASDDTWVLADPVQDAMLKVEAIAARREEIGRLVEGSKVILEEERQAVQATLEADTNQIRQQIQQLQQLLERTIGAATTKVSELDARMVSIQEAAMREQRRLDLEAKPYRDLIVQIPLEAAKQ